MEREAGMEKGKNGLAADATRPCPECSMGVLKADCPLCLGSGWVTSQILNAYLEYMESPQRLA